MPFLSVRVNTNRANAIAFARTEESKNFSAHPKIFDMLDAVEMISYITEIMFIDNFIELWFDNNPWAFIVITHSCGDSHEKCVFLTCIYVHRIMDESVMSNIGKNHNRDSYITEKRQKKRKVKKIFAKKRMHCIM